MPRLMLLQAFKFLFFIMHKLIMFALIAKKFIKY